MRAASARGGLPSSDQAGDMAAVCRSSATRQGMWQSGAGRLTLPADGARLRLMPLFGTCRQGRSAISTSDSRLNDYSQLAHFIATQFCAMLPILKIMEIDIDDVAWKTELRTIKNGCIEVPSGSG